MLTLPDCLFLQTECSRREKREEYTFFLINILVRQGVMHFSSCLTDGFILSKHRKRAVKLKKRKDELPETCSRFLGNMRYGAWKAGNCAGLLLSKC